MPADATHARAHEFPRLAALLSPGIDSLVSAPVHVDGGRLLLVLLGRKGGRTHELLQALEASICYFDASNHSGWAGFCRRLASANQPSDFLSRTAELVVARWLDHHDFRIVAFEPETADGKRPDLLTRHPAGELFIEVVAPGMSSDSVDLPNARLHEALERVESGLTIEVSGYEAHAGSEDPDQQPGREILSADVDAVVREFRQNAASIDASRLPVTVVEPRPGQPVQIVATGYDMADKDGTFVTVTSGISGLVPDVARLAKVIRKERKHLPIDSPGAILVDLSRYSDFLGATYYLDQLATALAQHRLPEFVGTFFWQSDHSRLACAQGCTRRRDGQLAISVQRGTACGPDRHDPLGLSRSTTGRVCRSRARGDRGNTRIPCRRRVEMNSSSGICASTGTSQVLTNPI
jgi:hypothetical protein